MLQSRMRSSVERLIHFYKMVRYLKYAANAAMPEVLSVNDKNALTIAAKLILSGQAIAIPTDTIYGIAASAQNSEAVKQLYEIKRRDAKKPIAICVGNVSDVHLWGDTKHLQQEILESLLPGAVTIVLKRKDVLNPLLNPGVEEVGIRIPNCPFVQELAKICDVPLALTSANLSSEPSSLKISEFSHLWPSLAAVFDGGTLLRREGSTVIDLSQNGYFKIIRDGSALDSTLSIVKKFGLIQRH